MHGAYEPLREEFSTHVYITKRVLNQEAAKAVLARVRHERTTLLGPYQPHALTFVTLDHPPLYLALAVRRTEATVLGGVGRELVQQENEGRRNLRRQNHSRPFQAGARRLPPEIGFELPANERSHLGTLPLALHQ